jgi:DNA-binding MarR family transcriptional regulator
MSISAADTAADQKCRELAIALERRVGLLWGALLRADDAGLSRTGGAVLYSLREGGPLRITELAAREGVAQPSMTGLINRLERDSLVERRPDPEDARACLVAVTERGVELLALRAALRTERLSERVERLSAKERRALEQALDVLDRLVEPEGAR